MGCSPCWGVFVWAPPPVPEEGLSASRPGPQTLPRSKVHPQAEQVAPRGPAPRARRLQLPRGCRWVAVARAGELAGHCPLPVFCRPSHCRCPPALGQKARGQGGRPWPRLAALRPEDAARLAVGRRDLWQPRARGHAATAPSGWSAMCAEGNGRRTRRGPGL